MTSEGGGAPEAKTFDGLSHEGVEAFWQQLQLQVSQWMVQEQQVTWALDAGAEPSEFFSHHSDTSDGPGASDRETQEGSRATDAPNTPTRKRVNVLRTTEIEDTETLRRRRQARELLNADAVRFFYCVVDLKRYKWREAVLYLLEISASEGTRALQPQPPKGFAVPEAFNSKNWKGQVAFTGSARVRILSLWRSLLCLYCSLLRSFQMWFRVADFTDISAGLRLFSSW